MRRWAILPLLLVGGGALAADSAEEILFNGKNFKGWTFFLEEKGYNVGGKGKISDFASVEPGGIIRLDPKYHGALMTKKDYEHYKLHVEFRWPVTTGQHNSGLFLRTRAPFAWDAEHGEMARMYMVQVGPGTTGDLWVLGYYESALKSAPERSNAPYGPGKGNMREHKKSKDAEKPIGEWNSIDVTLVGKTASIWVNGELVNEGTGMNDLTGRIGLESEFGPIEFRNLRVTPLPAPPPPPPPPPRAPRGGAGNAAPANGAPAPGDAARPQNYLGRARSPTRDSM